MSALPLPPGQTARAWQVAALAAIQSAAQSGLRRVVVSAATGTGKGTLLAGLARAAERGRVLILVHRDELIRDLAARVRLIPGGLVGIVRGAENGLGAPIVVASVQTLRGERLRQVGRFGLVITDECHHAVAATYQAIYERVAAVRKAAGLPEVLHVGMTATPWRTAAGGGVSGLGAAFEAIVYEHGIVEAIAAGDLVRPIGVRIDTQVELDRVGMRGRDYDQDELAAVIDCDARNEAVARWYAENGEGRPFLGFGVSIAHAERLAEALQGVGVACAAVHGSMPMAERRRLIGAYQNGELTGLFSRDLLLEGFDAPRTEALLVVRPTKSEIIRWQMLGRGLRLAPGKSSCVVADFVGFLSGLDLSMRVGIEAGAEGKTGPVELRPLMVGDVVAHRYDEGLGLGQLLSTDGVIGTVAWGLDSDAPRVRQVHGIAELRRARPEQVEMVAVPMRVTGQTEHLVHLLPASASRAWVEVEGDWIASARAAKGGSLHAVVTKRTAGWALWMVVRSPDGAVRSSTEKVRGEIWYRPGAAGRVAQMAAGEAWLARGLPTDLSEAWRQDPATDADLMAARAAGIRRPLEGLSRGEVVALVGAAWGRAAVAAELRRIINEHKGGAKYAR
jgi:superfamily II DNA or RNA helicase